MTGAIPGGMPRPPGSQPLFERARKRVTQRLSLAGLNSGGVGSAKFKIPAAEAPPAVVAAPAPQEQVEAVLALPASVLIPILPETVLLADPAALQASPQGQMDFRLPLGAILPMLPSGKIEFSIGDLSQCAPEGIIHPLEALGEWASQTILLPLPQVVMRIPPEFMTLRRDQKPIDTAVAAMDDPFSPEALRAKAEAAQAAMEQAAPVQAEPAFEAPPVVEPPAPPEEFFEPVAAVEEIPEEEALPPVFSRAEEPVRQDFEETPESPVSEVPAPVTEPDFSFTQSAEYQALLSKLQMVEQTPDIPRLEAEAIPEPPPVELEKVPSPPEPQAPVAKPTFAFATPTKPITSGAFEDIPPALPNPPSPLSAAVGAVPSFAGNFNKALQGLAKQESEAGKPPFQPSELHGLMRLPAEVPAGFKEFTRQLRLWPGMKSCVICGPDGLPIASAGSEGKSGDSLAALAPRLFKNASTLLSDLGRTDLYEMNFPGAEDSLTLFRNSHFILITVHIDEQLPNIYRQNIREALALLAQSGPG